jgi:hypothetical protein
MMQCQRRPRILMLQSLTPLETSNQLLLLVLVLEGSLGRDSGKQVGVARRAGTHNLLGGFPPGNGLLEEGLLVVTEEANVDQDLDEGREAAVAESATDDGVRLGDVVSARVSGIALWDEEPQESLPLRVAGAVSVSVGDEVVAGEARVVGLSGAHEVHASDVLHLAVLEVLGVVLQGEEHAAAAPAELVSCVVSASAARGNLGVGSCVT